MADVTRNTKSGAIGWQGHLVDEYDHFADFDLMNERYGIAEKLGFKSAREAWDANPFIQGSTDPDDYCRIYRASDFPKDVPVNVTMRIEMPMGAEDDPNVAVPEWKIKRAVVQAIQNSLEPGNNHGFCHDDDGEICLTAIAVE